MLPTTNISIPLTFLDLPPEIISPYLCIQDVRNCSLVCNESFEIFLKNNYNHHLNLQEDVLHQIFVDLPLRDLKNCSLTCRLLGRAIHMDSFWQKKSYQDFFPLYKPMSPYKDWYQLSLRRTSSATPLRMLTHQYTLTNLVSYRTLMGFTPSGSFSPDPDHIWMLEEEQNKDVPAPQNLPSKFLVGKSAFLYALIREVSICNTHRVDPNIGRLFRSTSILDHIAKTPLRKHISQNIKESQDWVNSIKSYSRRQFAEELIYWKKKRLKLDNYIITVAFTALPQDAKNEVYGKLYEIMQPSVHYWGWGEDAFHDQNGLISTDQQKIAAIQSYATSCTSNGADDVHYFKMLKFFHLSQEDRNNVYEQLYLQMQPPQHYWGWGEDAFHDKNDQRSTKKQKSRAIIAHYLG